VLGGLLLAGMAQAQQTPPGQPRSAPGSAPAPLPGELPAALQNQVQMLAASQISVPGGARVEVLTGTLDPRLKLAPCAAVEPHLPAGVRPWGATRVGLRCTSGAVRWNVYLPITVKVWAQAVVAATPLAAGTELTARDLLISEVDIAAAPSPTFERIEALLGRRLASGLAPGAALRADMLRVRQWFAAGDPVTLITRGEGFSVSGAGEALGPGLDGQSVRVRTEGGRIVVGLPVGERRVDLR
jgi:flagella basal body P-ring formation protein FlgA